MRRKKERSKQGQTNKQGKATQHTQGTCMCSGPSVQRSKQHIASFPGSASFHIHVNHMKETRFFLRVGQMLYMVLLFVRRESVRVQVSVYREANRASTYM